MTNRKTNRRSIGGKKPKTQLESVIENEDEED